MSSLKSEGAAPSASAAAETPRAPAAPAPSGGMGKPASEDEDAQELVNPGDPGPPILQREDPKPSSSGRSS